MVENQSNKYSAILAVSNIFRIFVAMKEQVTVILKTLQVMIGEMLSMCRAIGWQCAEITRLNRNYTEPLYYQLREESGEFAGVKVRLSKYENTDAGSGDGSMLSGKECIRDEIATQYGCRDYIPKIPECQVMLSYDGGSERGIRKLKTILNDSCTFCPELGADAFLLLHSFAGTAKTHGKMPCNAIQALF